MEIATKEEFFYCLNYNINPLFWNRIIKVNITLRIELQNEIFKPHLGIEQANNRYYQYCYENSLKVCVNCGMPSNYLKNDEEITQIAKNVSHIITRGSNPNMAFDLRNHNILCFKCHSKWESEKNKEMLIYYDNKVIIKELREDYNL
jgi:hypothetical protein